MRGLLATVVVVWILAVTTLILVGVITGPTGILSMVVALVGGPAAAYLWKQRRSKKRSGSHKVKILAAIGVLGLLALAVYSWSQADANTRFGVLVGAGTIIAGVLAHQQTKKREIAARMFAEKRKAWVSFLDLFFQMAKARSGSLSQNDLQQQMLAFKKDLIVWAGPELLQAWNSLDTRLAGGTRGIDPEQMMVELDQILGLIRKDLGHSDTLLEPGALVQVMLKKEKDKDQR